jgi:hypothetical protein
MYLLLELARIDHARSGCPPKSLIFLSGSPFEPDLAGIIETIFRSVFNINS